MASHGFYKYTMSIGGNDVDMDDLNDYVFGDITLGDF